MSKTNELIAAARDAAKTSKGNSKKVLVDIAHSYMNDSDFELNYYSADSEGNQVVEKQDNVAAFRAANADDVCSALNLDKDDRATVESMPISRKTASAMMDIAKDAVMEYLETGRRLNMPTINPNNTRVSLQQTTVAEKEKDTTKIEDGKMVKTGNHVTTFEHQKVTTKNGVYPWQKKIEKI